MDEDDYTYQDQECLEGDDECEEDWESEQDEGDPDEEQIEEPRSKLFAEDIEAIKEHNRRSLQYGKELASRGGMNTAKAHHFLESELVDVSEVENMVLEEEQKLIAEYKEIDRQLADGEIDSFSAELKREQVLAKEVKIRHRLGLLSVGLTYDDLGHLSDDWSHIVSDACDEESREVRKDIRQKMKSLSPSERRKRLDDLLEEGEIDASEYNRLHEEFIW